MSETCPPYVIFDIHGYLYVLKASLKDSTHVQCVRLENCPASGVIVEAKLSLTTQHNHSCFIDRVVKLDAQDAFTSKRIVSQSSNAESSEYCTTQLTVHDQIIPKQQQKQLDFYQDSDASESAENVYESDLQPDRPVSIIEARSCTSEEIEDLKVSTDFSELACSDSNQNDFKFLTDHDSYVTQMSQASPQVMNKSLSSGKVVQVTRDIEKSLNIDSVKQLARKTASVHLVRLEKADLMTKKETACKRRKSERLSKVSTQTASSAVVLAKKRMITRRPTYYDDDGPCDSDSENDFEQDDYLDEALLDTQHKDQNYVPVSEFNREPGTSRDWQPDAVIGENSAIEILEGTHKNSFVFLLDGYLYVRNRWRENKAYMHCSHRRKHPFCQAKGVMEKGTIRLTKEHNHLPDALKIDKMRLRTQCRKIAAEDPNANLKTVFHEEEANLKDYPEDLKNHVINSMIKRQKSIVPDSPQNMDEFIHTLQENEQRFCSSISGQPFFSGFIATEEFSIATFISPSFLDLLEKVDVIHIDHMFQDALHLFKHLCSILISYGDHAFPLVYAFMTSESEEAYTILFNFLKQQIPALNPKSIVLDFDQKLLDALASTYPLAECSSGYFNYILAVWREMHEKNFLTYYADSREAQTCARMILALPLLPADNLNTGCTVIRRRMKDVPNGRVLLQGVLDFVQLCWLKRLGVQRFSVAFKPHRALLDIDGYLTRLKYAVRNTSENVWTTIEKLKQFEDNERKEFEKITKRGYGKRKSTCLLYQSKVKEMTDKLQKKKIDVEGFLEAIVPFIIPPTSDALNMYVATYPVKIMPQFRPLMQIVTLEQMQDQ